MLSGLMDNHIYRVAQETKPLPNDQKIVINRIMPVNEIRFIVKLNYESSTIILFVGIRHSVRDLLSDLSNYVWPANYRYASDMVNDVSASFVISSP